MKRRPVPAHASDLLLSAKTGRASVFAHDPHA